VTWEDGADGTSVVRSKTRNPCIGAEGAPGGLLVIGEAPTRDEDTLGTPLGAGAGRTIRKLVKDHWVGPVAYDFAIRCAPGKTKVSEKMMGACRPFLAQTIEEVRPKRIITIGNLAGTLLMGRSITPFTSRGGYAYLRGKKSGAPIPVFFLNAAAPALRNKFLREWFEADLRHALTSPNPPRGPWETETTVVTTLRLAMFAVAELSSQGWVSFDVETCGTMWNQDFEIISVSLVGSDKDDVWTWDRDALADPQRLHVLLRLLQDSKVPKGGQNVKYDQLAFRARYKIKVDPIVIDTRLQRKLLDPEADGALGKMAELVGMGGLKEEAKDAMDTLVRGVKAAFRKKTTEKQNEAIEKLALPAHIEAAVRLGVPIENFMYALLPDEVLTRYNARDSVATKFLGIKMQDEISKEPRLARMWQTHVLPAAVALERVEAWGMACSRQAITQFDNYLGMRETMLKTTLDQYGDVNWDSPVQVADLLFGKLKLKPLKTTAGGSLSTDAETLEHLAAQHPIPRALLDYRTVTKLRGTYAQGMFEHVREDGRIHPNVKLDGARSGRTSCVDPNLQNIPRAQTPEGKMSRDIFVAPPGKLLVELDYSQLELRVAAMLSGDKLMLEIFLSGTDYHRRTAELISKIAWGIDPDKVEDKHRSWAKNVNFGVLYGKTARTFAKEWGISIVKAEAIVAAIMGNFKDLQRWCAQRQAEVQKTGEVWTWWAGQLARKRPLWRVADPDDYVASTARNGAMNSPIQGTASDFCIASLYQSVQWIEEDGIEDDVKLVLPVHDSLMFEVSEHMVNEVVGTVTDIMTGHDSNGVPLIADCKVGKAWGSMEKWPPKAS
jgi:uracil-DNA glycosylase family 4